METPAQSSPPILVALENRINALFDSPLAERTAENLLLLAEFRDCLNRGVIRVAEPDGDIWRLHEWVKKGILLHGPLGRLIDVSLTGRGQAFDLDTLPPRRFNVDDNVRVPPGAFVRDGSYLAPGVVCMPSAVVNLGAYVGAGSLLDSHVTIGLCAQIGERVHIASGANIGGVINPLQQLPTIVCNDVVIGGNCGIYDGVFVGEGALISAGTILNGQTPIYDVVRRTYYRASPGELLIVPPFAVVFPGAHALENGAAEGPSPLVQIPVIIGYRDAPTAPKPTTG